MQFILLQFRISVCFKRPSVSFCPAVRRSVLHDGGQKVTDISVAVLTHRRYMWSDFRKLNEQIRRISSGRIDDHIAVVMKLQMGGRAERQRRPIYAVPVSTEIHILRYQLPVGIRNSLIILLCRIAAIYIDAAACESHRIIDTITGNGSGVDLGHIPACHIEPSAVDILCHVAFFGSFIS